MTIYWNNVILNHLQKKLIIVEKYRLNTDLGRIYFYFLKECKEVNSEMTVKIIFFPKKEFPINK